MIRVAMRKQVGGARKRRPAPYEEALRKIVKRRMAIRIEQLGHGAKADLARKIERDEPWVLKYLSDSAGPHPNLDDSVKIAKALVRAVKRAPRTPHEVQVKLGRYVDRSLIVPESRREALVRHWGGANKTKSSPSA